MANITPTYETTPTYTQRDWDPMRLMREMVRWDPFQAMAPSTYRERPAFNPAFDVAETDDAYLFSADLPGLDAKDVDVTITGNRITISGKREEKKETQGRNWYTCERTYGQFSRAFTLPEGCRLDEIKADLNNGVLMVNVPKKAEVKSHRVPVGNGNGKNKGH